MAQRGTIVVCEFGHRIVLQGPGVMHACPEIVTDSDGVSSPCGSEKWHTLEAWPFPLTWNDRRFLRSVRISRDD